jgi:hypothetical protein
MMLCIDDFPRVIKHITSRNKVSSLIVCCDARLITEVFITTNVINCGLWRETTFFASLVGVFIVVNIPVPPQTTHNIKFAPKPNQLLKPREKQSERPSEKSIEEPLEERHPKPKPKPVHLHV